jgi:NAD(P)-dependent dehydrogenase (short-subunit alcohol dehydrogenase family)
MDEERGASGSAVAVHRSAAFLASPAASYVTGETYTAKGVPQPGNSMETFDGGG